MYLQIQNHYFESCYNSYLNGFDDFDKENETLENMLSKLNVMTQKFWQHSFDP